MVEGPVVATVSAARILPFAEGEAHHPKRILRPWPRVLVAQTFTSGESPRGATDGGATDGGVTHGGVTHGTDARERDAGA